MPDRLRRAYATDSGMHCLWSPTAFSAVHDYNSWEAELLEHEDIERRIEVGDFVPINIQSDGVFEIDLRVGSSATPVTLTERESKYLTVESELYRFASRGRICVSGIEHVDAKPGENVGTLDLPEGDYAVKVCLIAWDEEPNMKGSDGKPAKAALPDFIVLVNPKPTGQTEFRTKVNTFPPPPA